MLRQYHGPLKPEGSTNIPYASMPTAGTQARRQWRSFKTNARFFYWHRLTRRSTRLMRRLLILLVAAIALFAIWNFMQPEEKRVVRKEDLSKEHLRDAVNRRLHAQHRDLRIWNGWKSINTIFALYVILSGTNENRSSAQY